MSDSDPLAALVVHRRDTWFAALRAEIRALPPAERDVWTGLVLHARQAKGAKPTAKWRRIAAEITQDVAPADLASRLGRWCASAMPTGLPGIQGAVDAMHADLVRGLVWFCGLVDDPDVARALGSLAFQSFKKVPGVGPRALKVGNACIHVLGGMTSETALGQLAVLKARIKGRSAQNAIEKALAVAAERLGVARDELEELGVPSFDLDRVGEGRESIGDFTARLTVDDSLKTRIAWVKPDLKPQKSVPAKVRAEHADALKELRGRAKDVQSMLAAQRDRLDQLAVAHRDWAYPAWRARYYDHPIVGVLARRLIWRFESGEYVWDGLHDDERDLVDRDGIPLDRLDDETRVALWHPIGHEADEVLAWRRRLESIERRQPFKQAHREVYLVTEAERRTRVYSNRFAAHVLKQHQFNALCQARGWHNRLRLMVDDFYGPPTKPLPQWNLRAEFWVEGIHGDWGEATNAAGVYHHVATDQVRFYPLDAGQRYAHATGGGYQRGERDAEPIPVADVPPLVFSEIMRDVDLFVGVASVANDPNWADGGPEGRYRDYWQEYAFGDLGASAKTRRDVLSRLLPRLNIADRCTLEDRFLTVRGDLRSYKIHLGSGNILMTPNDQYLCIVTAPTRDRNAAGRVFLPFEGDAMMGVILSKAFLLAADTKIEDPTIREQIAP